MIHNEVIISYNHILAELKVFRTQLGSITPGIGRIIAKLEPMLTKDYLDPKVKAESDRLGEEALNRLAAEHKARQHTIDGSF